MADDPELAVVVQAAKDRAQRALPVLYSEELAEQILDAVITEPLYRVLQRQGMPGPTTVYRWMRDNPEFREKMYAARSIRALAYEDKAIEAAEDATGKDDTPAQRLKYDAYVWAAGVNDPTRFGKKLTVEGNAEKPVVFNIVTGVPAPLPHQMPPELGADGIVRAAKPVVAEVSEPVVEAAAEEAAGGA